MSDSIPEGFERHTRRSPLTDPWEPLYSKRTDKAVIIGLRLAKPHTNGRGLIHGGLIAALTAALLQLPVDNWPVLGGMGNASWVQLAGHTRAGGSPESFDDIRWRLDVWNASAQVAGDVL